MAVTGNTFPTLTDWAQHLDPNGSFAPVVESLKQRNDILDDMVWIEGNLPTGHETTSRAELPDIELVGYNEGVTPSKSTKRKISDTCATLMGFSEVDARLVQLAGKKAEMLASEDEAFLQSFNNRFSDLLVQGSMKTTDKGIDGFLTRYSPGFAFPDDDYKKMVLDHIIDAGGAGNNCTSILLVGWAKDLVTGMFPKGSKMGWNKREMGLQTIVQANSKKFVGYQTQYWWDFGITIRDPRFVVRLVNIDMSTLTKDASAGADLIDLMVQQVETLEDAQACRPVFYCNRRLRTWLRRQIANKHNVNLSIGEVAGRKVVTFDDIPVRRVDAMNRPEVAITLP